MAAHALSLHLDSMDLEPGLPQSEAGLSQCEELALHIASLPQPQGAPGADTRCGECDSPIDDCSCWLQDSDSGAQPKAKVSVDYGGVPETKAVRPPIPPLECLACKRDSLECKCKGEKVHFDSDSGPGSGSDSGSGSGSDSDSDSGSDSGSDDSVARDARASLRSDSPLPSAEFLADLEEALGLDEGEGRETWLVMGPSERTHFKNNCLLVDHLNSSQSASAPAPAPAPAPAAVVPCRRGRFAVPLNSDPESDSDSDDGHDFVPVPSPRPAKRARVGGAASPPPPFVPLDGCAGSDTETELEVQATGCALDADATKAATLPISFTHFFNPLAKNKVKPVHIGNATVPERSLRAAATHMTRPRDFATGAMGGIIRARAGKVTRATLVRSASAVCHFLWVHHGPQAMLRLEQVSDSSFAPVSSIWRLFLEDTVTQLRMATKDTGFTTTLFEQANFENRELCSALLSCFRSAVRANVAPGVIANELAFYRESISPQLRDMAVLDFDDQLDYYITAPLTARLLVTSVRCGFHIRNYELPTDLEGRCFHGACAHCRLSRSAGEGEGLAHLASALGARVVPGVLDTAGQILALIGSFVSLSFLELAAMPDLYTA